MSGRARGRRVALATAAVAVVACALVLPATATVHPRGKLTQKAKVASVVDGDTINVVLRGKTEPVRFIGIDTPEVYPVKDCGGPEASASMNQMLKTGDRVKLIRDRSQGNRDIYDRLLRYVELKGKDLGRKQVGRGWAETFVYDRPFARLGGYRKKQKRARRQDRGVWGQCPHGFPPP
ncbi:MAG: thermonuclease family protein [Solirubrobacterales bacterium]